MTASGLNCTTFCCSGFTSQPSPPGCCGGSWVARLRDKGAGATATEDSSAKHCYRSNALASRWRILSLDRVPIPAGSLSGLKGAGESNGTLMDALLLCSRKRSLSQSKGGLREASGDLGLRPQSNQGEAPLHWLIRESRFSSKISSIFLLLQEKT